MDDIQLREAIASVPPGRWAVAVSGGADSVALLALLRARADLSLHIVHLDHETRGAQSAADADFVRELAEKLGLTCTIARRSDIERGGTTLESNPSARYRAARLQLFRQVVADKRLDGVILAHHADDQAETVLQRLVRGAGPAGLIGMSREARLGGTVVLRPLLNVPRAALREVLEERGVAWREDASNLSPLQQRNRARQLLSKHPQLAARLIELAAACQALTRWLRENAPQLPESFELAQLRVLSPPLARESARRWLAAHAGADVEIPPAAVERLIEMAVDAASPARRNFPGGLLVFRQKGRISSSRRP